ncbi:hypothetical protein L0657_06210 [Dyadobacter sp. CY345]|uniref:hypothetical protein n=1 Tax=Dyadobacter sp. CY345 TaxID=2909335 RepID=UPI001F3B1FF0|nr:hypothetical protein [Dyadobacter sp. CY345]MCF2443545.1 hypothetical protein [Dyadobacter sp. CY345]
MKLLSLLFLLFTVSTTTSAQLASKVMKLKNGSDITKNVPVRDRYLYDEFYEGKVHFRNGTISIASLNYSLFHGEIQFITPQKDTLLLRDNDYVKKISINSDIFYFDRSHGHVQAIRDFEKVKLGKQQRLLVMGHEKYAGYSEYSETSAISSYSHFSNSNGEMQKLETNDKLLLRKKSIYYLIDQNLRFSSANRVNFIKIFPGHRTKISSFIKDNNTDFLKENDIVKLLEYCQSL